MRICHRCGTPYTPRSRWCRVCYNDNGHLRYPPQNKPAVINPALARFQPGDRVEIIENTLTHRYGKVRRIAVEHNLICVLLDSGNAYNYRPEQLLPVPEAV